MKMPAFITRFIARLTIRKKINEIRKQIYNAHSIIVDSVTSTDDTPKSAYDGFLEHGNIFIDIAKDRVYDEYRLDVIKSFRSNVVSWSKNDIERVNNASEALVKSFQSKNLSKWQYYKLKRRLNKHKALMEHRLYRVERTTLHIDNINHGRERNWSWN